MNLSDLTTTLETSLALQKAGVKIETVFGHYKPFVPEYPIEVLDHDNQRVIGLDADLVAPAYTSQEMADWVEARVDQIEQSGLIGFHGRYTSFEITKPSSWAEHILDLIEKKLITLSPTTEQ
ncbi:MAG: hypothetical protein V4714_17685 [Bacteroidota bacterium]